MVVEDTSRHPSPRPGVKECKVGIKPPQGERSLKRQ